MLEAVFLQSNSLIYVSTYRRFFSLLLFFYLYVSCMFGILVELVSI